MKKFLTLIVAVVAVVSVSAESYFLKSTWGEAEASWKQMIEDDGSFIFEGDMYFDGNDIAINTSATDEGARIIKVENIDALVYYSKAELAKGDSVYFIYVPDMYNQYNEKESGMMAMINYKNGYALKAGEVWKNMTDNDGGFTFILNDAFGGENVQLVTGSNIRTIKPENISTTMNYDFATLAKGDSARFIYVPDMYNQFDEKESGMMAMIDWKAGYAFKDGDVWEDMAENEGDFVTANTMFDGNAVQIIHESEIKTIKPENIQTFINNDFAQLTQGDSAMFIFNPEMYNQYNEKESGTMAMISYKKGYALKSTWEEGEVYWKNMEKLDVDTFIIENVIFDGNDVSIVNGNEIRDIKVENIQAYLLPDYSETELAEGDEITFMYVPSKFNRDDETQSGLSALVSNKIPQGVENVQGDEVQDTKSMKVMKNGVIYILRNNNTYNVNGVLVK